LRVHLTVTLLGLILPSCRESPRSCESDLLASPGTPVAPRLAPCGSSPDGALPPVVGSGARVSVDLAPGEPLGFTEHLVRFTVTVERNFDDRSDECIPAEITSSLIPTQVDMAALTPIFELTFRDDEPGESFAVSAVVEPSPLVLGNCIVDQYSVDEHGLVAPLSALAGASNATARFVGARSCPTMLICGLNCWDGMTTEGHCGACDEPCNGACIAGACEGTGLGDPNGLGYLASDGQAAYWVAPTDGAMWSVRRARVVDGEIVVDELAEHGFLLGASSGIAAWMTDRLGPATLERSDAPPAPIELPADWTAMQHLLAVVPVADRTFVLGAGPTGVLSIWIAPLEGGTLVDLPGCLEGIAFSSFRSWVAFDGALFIAAYRPDGGASEFWRCESNGIALDLLGEGFDSLAASADGLYGYSAFMDGSIHAIDPATGASTELPATAPVGIPGQLAADANGVYYLSEGNIVRHSGREETVIGPAADVHRRRSHLLWRPAAGRVTAALKQEPRASTRALACG
jgi:hypothetical protein